MTQETKVGRAVLAAFAKGRNRINAERKKKGEANRIQIYSLVLAYQKTGLPRRGLVRQIREDLGHALSVSRIRKIIMRTQLSGPTSRAYPRSRTLTGGTPNV